MESKKHFLKLLFYIALAVSFNIAIYFFQGERSAMEFLGGYVVEMTLSLDNLFLFLLIFSNFNINSCYQERVLKYGILGAMVLRLIFILLGVRIINRFHFLIYIFGILLIFSGVKMILLKEKSTNYQKVTIIKVINKVIPITNRFYGHNFFVVINKVLYATPLFVVLLIIELSDLIFALDSIPAVFSITLNPFIVYTSNIFAILGLRSMYHILARLNNRFIFMKYGVAFILIFTGIKLAILYLGINISTIVSVLTIIIILLGSILISLLFGNNVNKVKRI